MIKSKDIQFAVQSIATAGGTTTLTWDSPYYTIFTGASNQTIVLPNATTMQMGALKFGIENSSTGTITVQTNGGATLWTVAAGTDLYVTLTDNSTAAGSWEKDYVAAKVVTGKSVQFNNSTTISITDNAPLNFGSGGMQTNNGRAYMANIIGLNLF
jgi:hypothetical protein